MRNTIITLNAEQYHIPNSVSSDDLFTTLKVLRASYPVNNSTDYKSYYKRPETNHYVEVRFSPNPVHERDPSKEGSK